MPEPTKINFFDAFTYGTQAGTTLYDRNSELRGIADKNDYQYMMPSKEQVLQARPELKDHLDEYYPTVVMAFNSYQNKFDNLPVLGQEFGVEGETDKMTPEQVMDAHGWGYDSAGNKRSLQYLKPSFGQTVLSGIVNTARGLDPNREEDENDLNIKKPPTIQPLTYSQDPNTGITVWKQTDDLAPESQVRPMFGTRNETSTWVGSAVRGILSAIPFGMKAIGGMQWKIGEMFNDDDAKKLGIQLMNVSNLLVKKNVDELDQTHLNLNKVIYGVGSWVGMWAISMGLGELSGGTAIESAISKIPFAGKTLSKFVGNPVINGFFGFGGAAEMTERMKEMGFKDQDAARLYFPFAASMFIASGLVNMGLGSTGLNSLLVTPPKDSFDKEITDSIGEVIKESGTTIEEMSQLTKQNIFKKIFTKSVDWGTKMQREGGWKQAFVAALNNYTTIGTMGLIDSGTQAIGNSLLNVKAQNIISRYGNCNYTVDNSNPVNPKYLRVETDGSKKELSEEEWNAEQDDIKYANNIVDGHIQFKDIQPFSGFGTGGLENFVGSFIDAFLFKKDRVKLKDNAQMDIMNLAYQLEKDPKFESQMNDILNNRLKDGFFGRKDYDNYSQLITEDRQNVESEAQRNLRLFKEQIDLNRQLIRKYGLLKDPTGLNVLASDVNGRLKVLPKIAEYDKLLTSLQDPNVPEESKPVIQKQLGKLKEQIDYYIKPEVRTDENGQQVTMKYSKAYNDHLIDVEIIKSIGDEAITTEADQKGLKGNEKEKFINDHRVKSYIITKGFNVINSNDIRIISDRFSKVINTIHQEQAELSDQAIQERNNNDKKISDINLRFNEITGTNDKEVLKSVEPLFLELEALIGNINKFGVNDNSELRKIREKVNKIYDIHTKNFNEAIPEFEQGKVPEMYKFLGYDFVKVLVEFYNLHDKFDDVIGKRVNSINDLFRLDKNGNDRITAINESVLKTEPEIRKEALRRSLPDDSLGILSNYESKIGTDQTIDDPILGPSFEKLKRDAVLLQIYTDVNNRLFANILPQKKGGDDLMILNKKQIFDNDEIKDLKETAQELINKTEKLYNMSMASTNVRIDKLEKIRMRRLGIDITIFNRVVDMIDSDFLGKIKSKEIVNTIKQIQEKINKAFEDQLKPGATFDDLENKYFQTNKDSNVTLENKNNLRGFISKTIEPLYFDLAHQFRLLYIDSKEVFNDIQKSIRDEMVNDGKPGRNLLGADDFVFDNYFDLMNSDFFKKGGLNEESLKAIDKKKGYSTKGEVFNSILYTIGFLDRVKSVDLRDFYGKYRELINEQDFSKEGKIPNYEQEQAIIEAAINMFSDSTGVYDDLLLPQIYNNKDNPYYVPFSTVARAYPGVGKTDVISVNSIRMLSKMLGIKPSELNIVLVGLNNGNLDKLIKTIGDEFNILDKVTYTHLLTNNIVTDKPYIVVSDEISAVLPYPFSQQIREKLLGAKSILFMGDEGQPSDLIAPTIEPTMTSINRKTTPNIIINRNELGIFTEIIEHLRDQKPIKNNSGVIPYYNDPNTHGILYVDENGVRYGAEYKPVLGSTHEQYDQLLTIYLDHIQNKPNEVTIFAVFDNAEREVLRKKIESSGYDREIINKAVEGLKIVYPEMGNDIDPDIIIHGGEVDNVINGVTQSVFDSKLSGNPYSNKKIAVALQVIISRAKKYCLLPYDLPTIQIKDRLSGMEDKSTKEYEKNRQTLFNKNKQELLVRLDNILKDRTTTVEQPQEQKGFDRTTPLFNEEDILKQIGSQLDDLKNNKPKTDKTMSKHLYNLVMGKTGESLNPSGETLDKFFRLNLIRYIMADINDEKKDVIEKLYNKLSDSLQQYNNSIPEDSRISNLYNYVIRTKDILIHTPLFSTNHLQSPLALNPVISAKIDVKGSQDEYSAHPFIKIIGVGSDGKMIADLYYIRIPDKSSRELSDYGSLMLGGYLHALNQQGIKLNNVFDVPVSFFDPETKKYNIKIDIDSIDHNILVDKFYKQFQSPDVVPENDFVNEYDFYHNERKYEFPKGDPLAKKCKVGSVFVDDQGNSRTITGLSTQNGKIYIHFEGGTDSEKVSLDQASNYKFSRSNKMSNLFMDALNKWLLGKNTFPASYGIIPYIEEFESTYGKDPYNLNNPIYKLRRDLLKHLNPGIVYDKVYIRNFGKVVKTTGKTESWKHVIAYRIPENLIEGLAKELGITPEQFKEYKLNIVGTEYNPDAGFDVGGSSDNYQRGNSVRVKELNKFIEGDIFIVSSIIRPEGFQQDPDNRDDLVSFNRVRAQQKKDAYNRSIKENTNEVLLGKARMQSESTVPGSRRYIESQENNKFIDLYNKIKDKLNISTPIEKTELRWIPGVDKDGKQTGSYYAVLNRSDVGGEILIPVDTPRVDIDYLNGIKTGVEKSKLLISELYKEQINPETTSERRDEIKSLIRNELKSMDFSNFLMANNYRLRPDGGIGTIMQYLFINENNFLTLIDKNPERKINNALNLVNDLIKGFNGIDKDKIQDLIQHKVNFKEIAEGDRDKLMTRIGDVNQPYFYFDTIQTNEPKGNNEERPAGNMPKGLTEGSDEEFDKHVVGEISNPDILGKENAIQTLREIIGTGNALFNSLLSDSFITDRFGAEVYGKVKNTIVYLSNINEGKSFGTTEKAIRHEAMHFVTEYMLNGKSRENIFNEVKEKLNNPDATTEDIHEYLANAFENKIEVPKRSIIEKFIDWLKFLGHRLGIYKYDLDEYMSATNKGMFGINQIFGGDYIHNKDIDGEYSKGYNKYNDYNVCIKPFMNNKVLADYVRETYIRPFLIRYSFVNRDVTKSNETWSQSLRGTILKYITDNKTNKSVVDEYGNKDIFFIPGSTIQQTVRTEKNGKPIYTTTDIVTENKPYKVKDFSFNDLYKASGKINMSEKEYEDIIFTHQLASDPTIVKSFIQNLLPEINIDQEFDRGGLQSREKRGDVSFSERDNEKKNPAKTLSSFMKFVLKSIPYVSEGSLIRKAIYTSKLEVQYDPMKHVNYNSLHEVLINAALEIKDQGLPNKAWVNQLMNVLGQQVIELKDNDVLSKRNTILSFLALFGNNNVREYTYNTEGNKVWVQSKHPDFEYGLAAIVKTNPTWQEIHDDIVNQFSHLDGVQNNLNNKAEQIYTEFFSALRSHLDSLVERVQSHIEIQVDRDGKIVNKHILGSTNNWSDIKNNMKGEFTKKLMRGSYVISNWKDNVNYIATEHGIFHKEKDGSIGDPVLLVKKSGGLDIPAKTDSKLEQKADIAFRILRDYNVSIKKASVKLMVERYKEQKKDMIDDLYHILLIPHANEMDKNNVDQRNSNPIYKKVETFYRKRATKYSREVDENGKKVYSPTDIYDFWDNLAKAQEYISDDNYIRGSKDVEGNWVYQYINSSTFMDLVASGRSTILNTILNKYQKPSPLVTNVKEGTITSSNSILDKSINIENVNIFNGIQGYLKGRKYGMISPKQLLETAINTFFYDKVTTHRFNQDFYFFKDGGGDRQFKPLSHVSFNDENNKPLDPIIYENVKQEDGSYKPEVNIDHVWLNKMIGKIVDGYKVEYESSKERWNKSGLNNDSTLDEVRQSNLIANKDYIVKGDTWEKGYATTGKGDHFIYTKNFIKEWDKATTGSQKREVLNKYHSKDFHGFVDVLIKNGYDLNKISDVQDEFIKNEGLDNEKWHPVLESFYYLFHVINHNLNDINEGSSLQYSGVQDFFKRSMLALSPGTILDFDNPSGLNRNMRMLVLKDINRPYPDSDNQVSIFDGQSITIPAISNLMMNNIGGSNGILGQQMQKTILFYNDFNNGYAITKKDSTMVIDPWQFKNNPLAQDYVKTILGEELYNKYENDLKTNFYEANRKISNALIKDRTLLDKILFGITHESCIKTGQHNIQNYDISENGDLSVNHLLNNPNSTINLDLSYLRVQQDNDQDLTINNKNRPSQFSNLVGAHNPDLARLINNFIVDITHSSFNELREEGLRKILKHHVNNTSDNSKLSSIAGNNNIDLHIPRTKLIEGFASRVNNIIRLQLSGNTFTQAADFDTNVYWKNGQPYFLSEIGENPEGYTVEKLSPLQYLSDGRIRKADIIISYYYLNEFGIDKNTTLNQAMTYGKDNLYQKQYEKDTELYKRIQDVVLNSDSKIFDNLPQNIQQSIKNRKGTGTMKNAIINYYYDFNKTLDVLALRIPTGNASSGSIGRVIGFLESGENTIIMSPLKNFIDNSDFDIDQLQVYFRGTNDNGEIHKGTETTDGIKNAIFEQLHNYYLNPENQKMTMRAINEKWLGDKVDAITQGNENYKKISEPGSFFYHTQNAFDGNAVGYFANMESCFLDLASLKLTSDEYKTILPGINFDFENNSHEVISSLGDLIHVATVNAKLNYLGILNANTSTSSIILGMFLKGEPREIILEALQNSELKKIHTELINNNNKIPGRKKEIYQVLRKRIDELDNDDPNKIELEKFLEYAYTGEAVRRIGMMTSISKGIDTNTYDIYRFKDTVEQITGMNWKEILDYFDSDKFKINTLEDQQRFLNDNFPNRTKLDIEPKNNVTDTGKEKVTSETDNVPKKETDEQEPLMYAGDEANIRSKVDIINVLKKMPHIVEYLKMYDHFLDKLNDISFIDRIHNNGETKKLALMYGMDTLTEDGWNGWEQGLNDWLIGTYIKELENGDNNVSLTYNKKTETFDLKNPKDRERFNLSVPEYISYIQDNPISWTDENNNPISTGTNRLLNAIDTYSNFYTDERVIRLRNVYGLTPEIKQDYQRQFADLPEETQNVIRWYQFLKYNTRPRKGSLYEVIDTKLERNMSKWMRGKDDGWYDNWLDYFKQTIPFVNDDILSNRQPNSQIYGSKTNKFGDYFGKNKIMVRNNDLCTLRFHNKFNFFGGDEELLSNLPKVDFLHKNELEEIDKTGKVTIDEGKDLRLPIVNKKKELIDPSQKGFDLATTNDGTPIAIEQGNGTEYTLHKYDEEPIYESGIIKPETSLQNRLAINYIVDRIKSSLPGLNIEVVSNDNARNKDVPEYIYTDTKTNKNVVHINEDAFQLDTPIHTVTHFLLPILKNINPVLYENLRSQAIDLIESGSPLVKGIRENSFYSKMNDEGFIDEVIANIVGWHSVDKMQMALAKVDPNNIQTKAQTLWEKMGDIITSAWKTLKNTFSGIFGLEQDKLKRLETMTFKQLSDVIVDKVLKGEDLTYKLGLPIIGDRFSAIKNVKDLYDNLHNPTGTKTNDDLTDKEKTDNIEKEITSNKGDFYYVRGEPVSLIDSKGVKYTGPELRDLIKNEILPKQGKIFNTSFNKNINTLIKTQLRDTDFDKLFGNNIHEHPLISHNKTEQFRNILGHWSLTEDGITKSKQYMRYSDLVKLFPELSSDSFNDYDPIIAIEHAVKEGSNMSKAIISVYDITPDYLNERVPGNKDKNILLRYMSDKRANNNNISLSNDIGDTKKIQLGLLMNHILDKGKGKIEIDNLSIVSISPQGKDVDVRMVDPYSINKTFLTMGKSRGQIIDGTRTNFIDDIKDENLKRYFVDQNAQHYPHPNLSLVLNSYMYQIRSDDPFIYNYKSYDELGYNAKLDLLNHRLRYLETTGQGNTDNQEYMLLAKMAFQMQRDRLVDTTINEMDKDIGKIKTTMDQQFNIGHPLMETVHQVDTETSGRIIDIVNSNKKQFHEAFKFMIDKNMLMIPVGDYLYDRQGEYFKNLYVYRTDKNNKKYNTVAIHWKTNKKLDPLNAELTQSLLSSKKLSQEEIDIGKKIVDNITETLIDSMMHEQGKNYYVPEDKKKYSREDAYQDLLGRGYKPGMVPVMQMTTSNLFFQGRMKAALMKAEVQVKDVYTIFGQEHEVGNQNKIMDDMGNIFLKRFNAGNNSIGDHLTMEKLGLDIDPSTREIFVKDHTLNKMTSTNLELLMNYFWMSTHRKIEYENNVLPLANAIKVIIHDYKQNKGVDLKNLERNLDMYINQSVKNSAENLNESILGVKAEPVLRMAMQIGNLLTMTLNFNVGIISGIANMTKLNIEGFSNSVADAFVGKETREKNYMPGAQHILMANVEFWKNISLCYELLSRTHLVNMSERDLINSPIRLQSKKSLWNNFSSNIFHWSTNSYTTALSMIAFMKKEGSWDAVSMGKDGKIKYDEDKDKRCEGEKGQAFKKFMIEQMTKDGMNPLDENGKMTWGWDYKTMNTWATYRDKYIVGAFSNKTKAAVSQQLAGRLAMMYHNFFLPILTNYYQSGKSISPLGHWVMVKDADGNYIGQWESKYIEGQFNTIWELYKMARSGRDPRKELKPEQKYNLAKTIGQVFAAGALLLMYRGLTNGQEEEDIPRWKKNFKFESTQFWTFGGNEIIEWAKNPFAIVNIADNWIKLFSTQSERNLWWKIANKYSVTRSITEMNDMFTNEKSKP